MAYCIVPLLGCYFLTRNIFNYSLILGYALMILAIFLRSVNAWQSMSIDSPGDYILTAVTGRTVEYAFVAIVLVVMYQAFQDTLLRMLRVVWNESLREIHVQLMGRIQVEILKSLILERFGVQAEVDSGRIMYRETIRTPAEGVGHFEPLRHYAEVHLLLEPLERGAGLVFAADCPEDVLDKNWQRLVLTHLEERQHVGVLTGSPITDMKITLIAGRSHIKHTEGGDFRQATYRAVRQGLMCAESVLLEPYYAFRLEVPSEQLGRAINDVRAMADRVVTIKNGTIGSVRTNPDPTPVENIEW